MNIDYGNEELNDVILSLRSKLFDYLSEQGVIPEGGTPTDKFKCINPEHEDKNPSMGFISRSEGTRVKCYSCSASADIFTAATWLEGYPDEGPEWVTDNVFRLADRFEIPYTQHVPSTEELTRAKVLELYRDASDCLSGLTRTDPDNGFKHTRQRGLTDQICIDMLVGTVSYEKFVDTLQKYGGWDKEYIIDCGLDNTVFGDEFITITLMDHRGVVIGFDRRFVNFNKEDAAAARKVNQFYPKKFFILNKMSLFDPSSFMYGLYRCRKDGWRGVAIVEGYFDVLSALQSGVKAVISACGTSYIKNEHIDLLVKMDFKDLCFIFDNDSAGDKAVETCLKKFADRNDIRMSFKKLVAPDGTEIPDMDPDLFFRKFCKSSLDAYENIVAKSAFRIALELEIEKGKQGEELARLQIPHIASDSDPLRRGRMIKELSEKTGCSDMDIRAAVDVILTGKAKNIARDLKSELERTGNTPHDIASALSKAQNKLGPLFGGSNDLVTQRAARGSFYMAIDTFNNKKGALPGYRTLDSVFDSHNGGFQKGTFLVVYGAPNSGKSAYVHHLVNGMLRSHKENKDMIVVFFSFDDSANWSWAKQMAIDTGLPITWCAEPNRYIYHDAELTRIYKSTQDFYSSVIDDHFWVFGGDIGMSSDQMWKAIKNAQHATGKHVVVVVDSFNKMQNADGLDGTPGKEKNAEILHEMVQGGLSVIVTAETVKASHGRKPEMGDIADTKKLPYNANIVMGVFNPLHEYRERSQYFWVAEDHNNPGMYRKSAVIETYFPKNRITGYKGTNLLKFIDHVGRFESIDNINVFMSVQQNLWSKHGFISSFHESGQPSSENFLGDLFS